MSKPTIRPNMPVPQNIVKIAVALEGNQAQLITFNQSIPLTAIIQSLCSEWKLVDYENYALKFGEQNNTNYVTEKNRNEVKNGSVLNLFPSPAKAAADILQTLRTGNSLAKTKELEKLSQLASDLTFAFEFIKEKGMDCMIEIIEMDKGIGDMLVYALQSFMELMDHGSVSWDILTTSFINRIIQLINMHGQIPREIVQSSLCIVENIVQNANANAALVERSVTFDNLLKLLADSSSPVVQQNTIALTNALFNRGDAAKKLQFANLFATTGRTVILTHVIGNGIIGTEMSHQLHVLQMLTMGLLKNRMTTPLNTCIQEVQDKIRELLRIAFGDNENPADTNRRQSNITYKKLGFRSDVNPVSDFEAPPGILALDCMIYFAQHYSANYGKVVHENSFRNDEKECPFGRVSIDLVKLLCEVLKIGEAPSEQSTEFYKMFFTHNHAFEELYCVSVQVLFKTWKDMRATNEDFLKVFSVVREQVTRSLKCQPSDFEDFKAKINQLTYEKITTLRQQERDSREECGSTATAIVALKQKITPDIIALIRDQRLGYMIEGSRFAKYKSNSARTKDKFWYARLSPNLKVLHYGDCDEKTVPALEDLKNKIQVIDMKQLLVGKDCPYIKNKKATVNLAFSITIESTEPQTLDFVAPDDMTFNYWTDGINALIDQPMVSKQKEEDFETLLSMEIKLRLLDTEGVDISNGPPPIPNDPDNYDFCFDS